MHFNLCRAYSKCIINFPRLINTAELG